MAVTGTANDNKRNTKLIFKEKAPTRSCISKIDNTFLDSAEDPDNVILMYILLRKTSLWRKGSLRKCYGIEVNDDANETDAAGNNSENHKMITISKSFEYETKIIATTPADNSISNTAVSIPLKSSKFVRSPDRLLINFVKELANRKVKAMI